MKVNITNNGTKVLVSVRGKAKPSIQRMDAAARKALAGVRLVASGSAPNHTTRIYAKA